MRNVLSMILFGGLLGGGLIGCGEDAAPGGGSPLPSEGEGEGSLGEGEGEGEGPVAEGEGESPVCACASDADCNDGNFCNGTETCNCTCSPGALPDCADEMECTEDRCVDNQCMNVPAHARCGAGKICRPAEGGCVAPPPCRDDADCVPDDPCQTGTCDAATRACAFAPFDGDEDGHAPRVCGGDDCDDSTGAVSPDREDQCNQKDDNCDGRVDEGIDFQNDRENCGECGRVCSAGHLCGNGECVCPGEQTDCDGTCVNTQINADHCGECWHQCANGAECRVGECTCRDPEQTACGGDCTYLFLDEENCGECGHSCGEDQDAVCVNGECHCRRDGGIMGILCDGWCHFGDENNCGGCGNRCTQGAECINNQCVCVEYSLDNQWDDVRACEGHCLTCDEPDRGLVCRRTDNDENNCGACGRNCDEVHSTCNNGICECAYLECDNVCVPPADPNNCGRCGNRCADNHVCMDDRCCAPPEADTTCDGVDEDCDGRTDDNFVPEECYEHFPPCLGTTSCEDGRVICDLTGPCFQQ